MASPTTGSMPGATVATPASEKSVYYDADTQSGEHIAHASDFPNEQIFTSSYEANNPGGGADVARKPTITSGAEKHEDATTTGNVRNSGYAQGTGSPNSKDAAAVASSPVTRNQAHDANTNASPTVPARGAPQNTTEGAAAQPHTTGAFGYGAAATRPDAHPDGNVAQHERKATAEGQLSDEAKKKIDKAEHKDAQKLMKVIKSEGKAQKSHISGSLKELSKLQTFQKHAAKDETKAHSTHSKATARAHSTHSKFLKAKAAYEKAEADVAASKDALEMARKRAQDTTTKLAEKTREAEELRRTKAMDDREREARLQQLSQAPHK